MDSASVASDLGTITATLPSLGKMSIQFHKESRRVLEAVGRKELERLGRVNHLGSAAYAFNGAHHNRLEYMLLQCAVISLLRKLHKDDEQLALGNGVRLAGYSKPFSSGEELLKCWAIIGQFGHTDLTHAVERPILQRANRHEDLRRYLVHPRLPTDARNWCKGVIAKHQDSDFHYVLAFYRIKKLRPTNRPERSLMIHALRNLVVPIDDLDFKVPEHAAKMRRLRGVFSTIRLLSMVSLDSYYSHHPFRFQLASALLNLKDLLDQSGESSFMEVLRRTAGWLADELYLHPTSIAILNRYETMAHGKLSGQYRKALRDSDSFYTLFQSVLNTGFGKPRVGELVPLLRLSFPTSDFSLRSDSPYITQRWLRRKLAGGPGVDLSVSHNPFTEHTHVDFFVDPLLKPEHVAATYFKTYEWLATSLEEHADRHMEPLEFPSGLESFRDQFKSTLMSARAQSYSGLWPSLFWGIINFVLPNGYHGSVEDVISDRGERGPILGDFAMADGGKIRHLTTHLDAALAQPTGLGKSRLLELKALAAQVSRSKAPLVIACTEQFIIRDSFNRSVDEWDCVVLEVLEDTVKLTVIEAKGGRSGSQTGRAAKQLSATLELLGRRNGHKFLKYRRHEISKVGAKVVFSLK